MNTIPIFDNIPLAQITPSKTNPRKYFDEAALSDLAESIKTQGVAQPILVRSLKVKRKNTPPTYEIIAGERRYRASQIAGMETIPALIRVLTDQQALEIQVIENLQRADLHPLEEAEGYEQLMKLHKLTTEDLAAKVGKSKSYVYTRLKLLALEPEAREAFYDSKLTPSTAILIARIPVAKLQKKAVKDIVDQSDDPMSTKSAAAYIQRNFMLQLDEAPFPVDDASLVASAGSCVSCPKRTGNQPELFGDISCEDTCTDPECFNQKRAQHVAAVKAKALENGQKVLTGDEAREIRPNSYCFAQGYVSIDSRCYAAGEGQTYRELLGDDLPETALLDDPHTVNNLITIAKQDDVDKILIKKGIIEDKFANERKWREERTLQKKEDEKEMSFRQALFDEIRKTSTTENPALQQMILRLAALEMMNYSSTNFINELYGWKENNEEEDLDDEEIKQKKVDSLNYEALIGLIRDIALFDEMRNPRWEATRLLKIAELAGINSEAVRRLANEETMKSHENQSCA